MQMLDDHLFDMYKSGKISEEDTVERSQSPAEMQEKITALRTGAPDAQGKAAAPSQPASPAQTGVKT